MFGEKAQEDRAPTYRAIKNPSEDHDDDITLMVSFSSRIVRTDEGRRMFRIEIVAADEDAPVGVPDQIGRLVAYREHAPTLEADLEFGELRDYFWAFDAISCDACCAFEDLLQVDKRLCKKLEHELMFVSPENLIYVDKMFVEEGFRGQGIARAMMAELHDLLVGSPSLVFFQAMPFLSEMKAEEETEAWNKEHRAAIKAMARHWVGAEDLGFCQPAPRSHPQLIALIWGGMVIDLDEPRYLFIPIEEVGLEGDATPGGALPATSADIAPVGYHPDEIEYLRVSEIEQGKVEARIEIALRDLHDAPGMSDVVVDCIGEAFGIIYAACRREDGVSAVVLIPSVEEGRLRYDATGEDLGPFACDAPLPLLAYLTPARTSTAEEWRRKCWLSAQEARRA